MCGILRTAGIQSNSSNSSNRCFSNTKVWFLTGSDLRAVSPKCRSVGEDLSSIFTRKREDYTSLRKVTSKASPRNPLLSRSSLRCSLRTCWEHRLKTLHKRSFLVWFLHLVGWVFLLILKEPTINKIRRKDQLVELRVTHSKRAQPMGLIEPHRTVLLQPGNLGQQTRQLAPWQEGTSSNSRVKPIPLKMMESSQSRVLLNSRIFWWPTPKTLLLQEEVAWIRFNRHRAKLSLEGKLWQNHRASRIGLEHSRLMVVRSQEVLFKAMRGQPLATLLTWYRRGRYQAPISREYSTTSRW